MNTKDKKVLKKGKNECGKHILFIQIQNDPPLNSPIFRKMPIKKMFKNACHNKETPGLAEHK
jgi:hypothetical protein